MTKPPLTLETLLEAAGMPPDKIDAWLENNTRPAYNKWREVMEDFFPGMPAWDELEVPQQFSMAMMQCASVEIFLRQTLASHSAVVMPENNTIQ
jgi:hypothetical protein